MLVRLELTGNAAPGQNPAFHHEYLCDASFWNTWNTKFDILCLGHMAMQHLFQAEKSWHGDGVEALLW